VGVVVDDGEQVSGRVVDQDFDKVVVEVEVSSGGRTSPALSEQRLVEVLLDLPLGKRRVFGTGGREVPSMCCV